MKKKLLTILLATLVSLTSITGCGNSEPVAKTSETDASQKVNDTDSPAEIPSEDSTQEPADTPKFVENPKTETAPDKKITQNSQKEDFDQKTLDVDEEQDLNNLTNMEDSDTTGKTITDDIQNESSKEDIEMVDWITWATQPDNDDICLVVWNEENKTQKKLSNGEKYIIQTGDKLSVPLRTTIMTIHIDGQDVYFNTDGYAEIAVEGNDWVEVDILYKVEKGTGEYGDNKEYSIYEYFLKNDK